MRPYLANAMEAAGIAAFFVALAMLAGIWWALLAAGLALVVAAQFVGGGK